MTKAQSMLSLKDNRSCTCKSIVLNVWFAAKEACQRLLQMSTRNKWLQLNASIYPTDYRFQQPHLSAIFLELRQTLLVLSLLASGRSQREVTALHLHLVYIAYSATQSM